MLKNLETMFENVDDMIRNLKKKSYEMNMTQFLEKNGHFFQEMTDYVDASEDKQDAAAELAKRVGESVEKRFSQGIRRKIPSHVQADVNFFMIYYVFPALLKTEHAQCRLIADSICTEWKKRFKRSAIGYTDYDSLYESFREKAFGISWN